MNVEQNLRRGEGRVFPFIKKVHLHSIQEQTRTWPYHTQVCVIFMVTTIKIVGVMTDMKVTMTKIVSLMTDMKMMMTKIVGLMTDLMVMMVCWQRLVVGEPGPASSRALTKRYERRIVIVIIIALSSTVIIFILDIVLRDRSLLPTSHLILLARFSNSKKGHLRVLEENIISAANLEILVENPCLPSRSPCCVLTSFSFAMEQMKIQAQIS